MAKFTNKSKNKAYQEYTECTSDITDLYPEIIKYLQYHFGINRGQIYIGDDPGGESAYFVHRGEVFWLFEIDEFTTYFWGEELHEHISNRLASAYDRVVKKYL